MSEEEFLDQEERSTIAHHGDEMHFVSHHDGACDNYPYNVADISNYTCLDLGLVGNVRPNWFLEKEVLLLMHNF